MFDGFGECVLDGGEVLLVEVVLDELHDERGFAWREGELASRGVRHGLLTDGAAAEDGDLALEEERVFVGNDGGHGRWLLGKVGRRRGRR